MAGRASGLVLALLTLGCASTPAPPVIPPSPVRAVPLGLNDGFHGPLPPEIVARYCGLITLRTPQLSGAALDALLASIASCPQFRVLALVENPDVDLARQFAARPVWGIELGNELELAPNHLAPPQYATFVGAASVAIRAINPSVILLTGGVYTLDDDTKQRITLALSACPFCGVGIHLYEPLEQADLDWLTALHVPIAVTETGFPTRCDSARMPQQLTFLQGMIAQLSTVPTVSLIAIYQRPSGADCSDLSTFGIDGKPAEVLLQ